MYNSEDFYGGWGPKGERTALGVRRNGGPGFDGTVSHGHAGVVIVGGKNMRSYGNRLALNFRIVRADGARCRRFPDSSQTVNRHAQSIMEVSPKST